MRDLKVKLYLLGEERKSCMKTTKSTVAQQTCISPREDKHKVSRMHLFGAFSL